MKGSTMKYVLATAASLALASPALAEDASKTETDTSPETAPQTVVSSQGTGALAGGVGVGTAVAAGVAVLGVIAVSDSSAATSGT